MLCLGSRQHALPLRPQRKPWEPAERAKGRALSPAHGSRSGLTLHAWLQEPAG